ncbi:hypothetical protein F5050DRAFT_1743684 [Lentinula boryana]|uniref:DNA replication checkpoint mediator MRC1 domain-containing protein n=1 Tax=Lentinula boryana TaxID=40481 RepID=A0ABQ8QJK3_9AGAR|nr:hypothetical protein F5050DRAFT_1743684 [Lentinula boryana]
MTSSSPPVVPKRPTRTYGRPKPVIEVSASTLPHHKSSFISNLSLLSDISYDTTGEAPATSEPPNSSPAGAEDEGKTSDSEGSKDALPRFQWDWKAKMKQLDESEEEEEGGSPKKIVLSGEFKYEGSKPTHSGPLSPEQRDADILPPIASPSRATEPSLSQGPFSGSLSTLTPSSLELSQKTLTSPSPSPTFLRKRASQHKKVVESDGESEQGLDNKSSNPSSPVKHSINTPQKRSSTTPPTSDSEHDMPRKAKPSSKGKSTVANPLVLQPAVVMSLPKVKRKRSQSTNVKAPTKKERRATAIDRQRLNAERPVSISSTQRSNKLTVPNLLSRLAGNMSSAPLKGEDSMDPISDFSSSPGHNHSAMVEGDLKRTESEAFYNWNSMPGLPKAADLDDEQLPDMDQLLKQQRMDNLKRMKLQIIQQQQKQQRVDMDDDDDLEIVDAPSTPMQVAIKKEAEERKSGRPSISVSTRTLQKHAGISVSRRTSEIASASQALNSRQLNEVLLKSVNAENARRTKEKSEEWVRRGGKLLEPEIQLSEKHGLDWYAQKTLEANKSKEEELFHEEDGDEEDKGWSPSLRGSASPAPGERVSSNEYAENAGDEDEGFEDDQDITMVNEDAGDEDLPTQVDLPPPRRSMRAVVNSDTEDEEHDENIFPRRPSLGRVLVEDSMILEETSDKLFTALQLARRQSDSSYDGGATEDEGDKENNDHLMYDRSEDKENTAVVRHGPLNRRSSLGRQSSLFNLEEGISSRLSVSSDGYATDEDKENPRSPLKTLSVAEIEPFTPAAVLFATRLQRATSAATIADNALDVPLSLSPEVARERQISGFSQFSDDEEGIQSKKLETGFSGFLDSDSQISTPARPPLESLKEPAQSNNFLAKLRRSDSLALTQDVGLQPALEVNESLVRQADRVFEREQEMLLEAMNESTSKKPELYINDQGFLTQTRPEGDAEVYRPPPTPSQPFSQIATQAIQSQSSSRQPFRELSMSGAEFVEETPVQIRPLRRLRKRDRSHSPSSTTRPTMFDVRSMPPPLPSPSRPSKIHRHVESEIRKNRQRLGKSVFVEGEAQESDEDEMFGFKKVEEDEEDGDHLDRNLETLVDDKAMDQSQMAEDKIMEKYQEHRQADDARDEELAQQVVDGQLRYGKRTRNRAGIDDSDEEDEENEKNRKIRRKMKEPELRGDIKSLAGQESTRAFAAQYEAGIKSDGDPELDFLQGVDSNDIIMTGPSYEQDDDDDGDNENENNEDIINRSDVMRQLREVAKNGEDNGPTLDPNDVSFVDADIDNDDEDLPRVRHVTNSNLHARGNRTQRAVVDPLDFEVSQSHKSESMISDQGRQQAEAFVKSENRLRRMGTSRSGVGGISVLGNRTHRNSRADSRNHNNPTTSRKPQPVKAAPSMLKGLTRRDHFQ